MRRAPEEERRRLCAHCAAVFYDKPSRYRRYCCRACKELGNRVRPMNDPRPCECCGAVFTPSRAHGAARFCSKSCIWKATKGPEFNARIAAATAQSRADAQRGRGAGLSYRKLNGRHEHRVVAEQKIGRPLQRGEIVHHIDGNHLNNDPANLAVMTQAEHMREHGLALPGVAPWWEPWKYRST